MKNKRLISTSIAVICASVVTVLLNYPPEVYMKMVLGITWGYKISQTTTDIKKVSNGSN